MMQEQEKSTPQSGSVEEQSRIAGTLTKMAVCVRSLVQYGRSHPLVMELAGSAFSDLSALLIVKPTVVVVATDSYFATDNFPLEDKTGALQTFAQLLNARQVAELRLTAGVTEAELLEFVEILCIAPEVLALTGGVAKELTKRGVTRIATRAGVIPVESREARDPAVIYEDALLLVEEALKAVQSGLQVPVPEIRSVVADSLTSLVNDDSALLALAGIRSYDRYLSEHSVNVCIFSLVLGRDLGMDPENSLELGVSAMLHDVGKVFVPGEIVKKPARLTEEEWEMIRRHPSEGARALAGIPDMPGLASTIAMEHHVYMDGSGYPSLYAGYKPHLLSRLVAIVDTYDALTTDRPYRERWTPEQAIAYMLYETPRHYDRELLARFASRARLYPVGSIVTLKNGDYAVVVGGSMQNPRSPRIRIVSDLSGSRSDDVLVDLAECSDPALEIETVAQPIEALLPYADRLIAA